jgi:hypothetical protein
MTYDEVIEAAAMIIANKFEPHYHPSEDEIARAVAPLLMEYGARLMQEVAILKAHELYPTMEVPVMLLNIDPAALVKEASSGASDRPHSID